MYFLTSTIESYQEVSPFLSAGNVPTCNSCNYLECITATLSHRYLQKFSTIHIRCILFLHIKDTVKLYLKFQKSNKNELLQSLHPYRNLGEKNVSCTTLRRWAASRVIEKQGFSFTGNARLQHKQDKNLEVLASLQTRNKTEFFVTLPNEDFLHSAGSQ